MITGMPMMLRVFILLWNCVCLFVRLPLLQRHPRLRLTVHSLVCFCAFGLALPLAISLFPQNSQVRTSNTLYILSKTQQS